MQRGTLTALIIGNVVLQFPLGWLADKYPHRFLLAACALITAIGLILLPYTAHTFWMWPLLIVLGTTGYGVYTVSLTSLGNRFSGQELVNGSASFAVMWGSGALLGSLSRWMGDEYFWRAWFTGAPRYRLPHTGYWISRARRTHTKAVTGVKKRIETMKFIERLQNKELLSGTMMTLPCPEVAEMISKCGFDWLFMDGEHSPLSTLDWQRMIQAVGGRCANLMRVPVNSEREIKKMLDIGADGIIAPKVNTADEAQQIVSWCKYPPQGERGVGLARAHGYGLDFADYIDNANSEIVVVIQAEHIDAVNNIESITDVSGIDCIFIGPYDLSASMGKMGEVDDAEVVDAIDTVSEVCKKKSIPLGYFGTSTEAVKPYINKGYNLICAGVDAGFVTSGALSISESIKT